jgi:predicted NACHT family NTPase
MSKVILEGLDYLFVDNSNYRVNIVYVYTISQLIQKLFDNAIIYTIDGFVRTGLMKKVE